MVICQVSRSQKLKQNLLKRVKFRVSGHFLEKAWLEWPKIWHADVSWSPSELIRCHGLLSFPISAASWLNEAGEIGGFQAFSWENAREEWPEICMLMYPDHLQNWLDFSHGLLIFLILVAFWLSEMGERMGGIAWDLVCWCILTTFRSHIRFWSWSVDFPNFFPVHSMSYGSMPIWLAFGA